MSTIVGPACIITNFYINQAEIIEEFCENKAKPELNCNGNCHLTKELSKQIDKTSPQEKSGISFSIFLPIAYNDIQSIEIDQCELIINHNSYYKNNYHYLVLDNILHPPQV